MSITLNGKPHSLDSASTISELLKSLGLEGKPVVVEHNHTALFPRDYDSTQLADNDQVEIITIAAGG
ncbi:sulfur carrier protein [Rubritalea squalenifaciens DSM 18772]|uniref:Sulfur carrier protein n=1 Tax=Rubritalea squalenifaciens DSM 18772 TaxID=1123071 RepID=A0A1M6HBZ4_9BACT|nr:sulfur carrier protein ThiS [Rubritalea squalenifaciens]SHJ19653.1 sulfur carrier protein [Rubritalea squalenifaciens DSM 18772]